MASLLKGPKAYIDGEWVGATSGKSFEVKNPANGEVIASVPDMNAGDANVAIAAAQKVNLLAYCITSAQSRRTTILIWAGRRRAPDCFCLHQKRVATTLDSLTQCLKITEKSQYENFDFFVKIRQIGM